MTSITLLAIFIILLAGTVFSESIIARMRRTDLSSQINELYRRIQQLEKLAAVKPRNEFQQLILSEIEHYDEPVELNELIALVDVKGPKQRARLISCLSEMKRAGLIKSPKRGWYAIANENQEVGDE
jgi:hypothetical protein